MRLNCFGKFVCIVLFFLAIGVIAEDENTNEGLAEEKKDFCKPNPCKNRGYCYSSSKKCSCKSGYSGVYCETCKCEKGVCKKKDNGDSDCICPPEWGLYSGGKCQKCDCGKDSNCTFDPGFLSDGKKCVCKEGYEDKKGFCTGTCNKNPCQNGGECKLKEKDIECKCKGDFSGELCEKKVLPSTLPYSTTEKSTVTAIASTTDTTTPTPLSTTTTTEKSTVTAIASTTDTTTPTTPTTPTPLPTTTTTEYSTSPVSTQTTASDATTAQITTTSVTGTDNTTVSNTTEEWETTTANYSDGTTVEDQNTTLPINFTSQSSTIPGNYSTDSTTTTTEEVTNTVNPVISCKNNPCKNGGTCQQNKYGFTCLCPYPYVGWICTDNYWCAEGLGKTFCEKDKCAFDFKTRIGRCSCQDGEYYDYDKRKCRTIDNCPLTPDKCKGVNEICENNECRCMKNYKRNEKKECVPNFCESSKDVCGQTATCQENPKDPENVKCVCKENEVFTGDQCIKVNKCNVPPFLDCQQICNETTQACDCYHGYALQTDKKSCKAETAESNCSMTCEPGICHKAGDSESCLCPPAYEYKNGTCQVIDFCETSKPAASLCPVNACESHPDFGFRCKCEGQLTYDKNNVTCRRKFMCSEGGGLDICEKKFAKCVEDSDNKDGYRCECSQSDEMDTDGMCKNKCALKKNRDKCLEKGALCEVDGSEVICVCPPLFTYGRCEELANASYTGSISFATDKYFSKTLFAPGKASLRPDYIKMKRDLRDTMRLLYGSNYKFADILSCNDSDSSLVCTVEIQFETEPRDQVKLIGDASTCIGDGPDTCFIPPQLVLSKKDAKIDLAPTDPCIDLFKVPICGGPETVCSRLGEDGNNFQCTCNKGFTSYGTYYPASNRRTVIHKCEDIDECLLPSSCPNSTECLNTFGSYECLCKEGYRTLNSTDDTKVTGCIYGCGPASCGKGKCKMYGSVFTCECDDGYAGAKCDQKVQVAGGAKGMEIALITLSTLVVPLILFSLYMVHKYRILNKALSTSGYLDDNASTLTMEPITPT